VHQCSRPGDAQWHTNEEGVLGRRNEIKAMRLFIGVRILASRPIPPATSNDFGAVLQDPSYGMMRLMASPIYQIAGLYGAMQKQIPSIQVEDVAMPKHQEPSRSPESIQQEQVRQLTEAGLDHWNNGKLEEADKCYEEALELCPDSMLALYGFGVTSGHLKRYEESKAAFERLLQLFEARGSMVDPTLLAAAHQGIGAALLGLWGATGAQEPSLDVASEGELEFRRALALDPKYFEAWLGLGLALHITERLDDAEAALRKALEMDPDSQVATERLRGVLEDKLEKRLFELGYLSRINKTIRDFTPYENRTLISVEGKPLSEIILEERR
jgi:tetratricopeptide (TPR) repeat protein